MHVIAIASQKGGVGKTTISLNLGLALARAGNRTLHHGARRAGQPRPVARARRSRARRHRRGAHRRRDRSRPCSLRTRDPQLHVLCVGRVDPTTVSGFEEALTRAARASPSMLAKLESEFDIVAHRLPRGPRQGDDARARGGDARALAAPGRAARAPLGGAAPRAHRSHPGREEPQALAPRHRALDVRPQDARVARGRRDAVDQVPRRDHPRHASSRATRSSSRRRCAARRSCSCRSGRRRSRASSISSRTTCSIGSSPQEPGTEEDDGPIPLLV